MDDRFLILLSAILYAGAAVYIGLHWVRGRNHSRPLSFAVIGLGFLVQTLGLYFRGLEVGACPIGNPYEVVQFIVWGLVALFLVVGPVFGVPLLGFFSSSFAALFSGAALIMPGWDYAYVRDPWGGSPMIELHAALAIFSYAAFALLAILSVMLLIQQLALEKKRHTRMMRFLPSIVQLDRMSLRLLWTGVAVFTVALVIGGFIWIGGTPLPSHKLGLVLLLWAGYVLLLVGRFRGFFPPKRIAVASVVLFVFALLLLGPIGVLRVPADYQAGPVLEQSDP